MQPSGISLDTLCYSMQKDTVPARSENPASAVVSAACAASSVPSSSVAAVSDLASAYQHSRCIISCFSTRPRSFESSVFNAASMLSSLCALTA